MGKTMLMIGLIRQLPHQPVALLPALSFFFYEGTDTVLNNATAVLRSVVSRISQEGSDGSVLRRFRAPASCPGYPPTVRTRGLAYHQGILVSLKVATGKSCPPLEHSSPPSPAPSAPQT